MAEEDDFCIARLDQSNYNSWRVSMEVFLMTKGLWTTVQPTGSADAACTATAGHGAAIKAGDATVDRKKDQQAKGYIGFSVSPSLHHVIKGKSTSKEMWDALARIFRPRTFARICDLTKDLQDLRKEPTETITQYILRAKGIAEELEYADATVGAMTLFGFVRHGLPAEYDTEKLFLQYQLLIETKCGESSAI